MSRFGRAGVMDTSTGSVAGKSPCTRNHLAADWRKEKREGTNAPQPTGKYTACYRDMTTKADGPRITSRHSSAPLAFTRWSASGTCFGCEKAVAMRQRRDLLLERGVDEDGIENPQGESDPARARLMPMSSIPHVTVTPDSCDWVCFPS